jgi:hypothetical protein
MIDPARLRPIDHLRLLEQLAENPSLGWMLADLKGQFGEMALRADTADMREAARQKYLAVDDVMASLQSRMAGFRAEHEAEMAAAKASA